MNAPLMEYRDLALSIAAEAAEIAVAAFGTVTADHKADGSLVTEVDESLDRLISDRIGSYHPGHAVLSEEQTTDYDPSARLTWVIDPIDGTTNYARGLPIWGISIGLLERGMPVVGVLVFPSLHEIYSAVTDRGAFRNDRRIYTSSLTAVEGERFICSCTRSLKRYQWKTPLKQRILGSTAYHLAKVADGTALATIEATPKLWDLAAAAVILKEAGGILESSDGTPLFPLPGEAKDYAQHSMPVRGTANGMVRDHIQSSVIPLDLTTRNA